MEDVVVDVGFWFKGSTNRKGFLAEFCELFESEYLEVLQHASVRWLSLETCVTRILRLYEPLASYFQSTEGNQPRLKRLQGAFSDPMTEVYLLFYQSTIPAFTSKFVTLPLFLFKKRYAHLLPYHSPQDHDSLGEEFLDYQTMPVPILEADPDIEGFWANMASLKHK
ncbi:hypothetical protein F7725_005112, partial [Dissostichus mawsoni]